MRYLTLPTVLALSISLGVAAYADDSSGKDDGGSALPKRIQMWFNYLPKNIEGWQPGDDPQQAGMAKQFFPFFGREDIVVRHFPDAYRYEPCPVTATDAMASLESAAEDAQIVIINEAHDQPLHRWTIQRLAMRLADSFDVFAAETFIKPSLAKRKPGTLPGTIGTYVHEPMFARELYALDEAGYRFVAYEIRQEQREPDAETMTERIAVREEAQANNLIETVLANDPDSRVLVHVGYSHALEEAFPRGGEPRSWFAARLKEKTGIDPLTISQTHCMPGPKAKASGVLSEPGALALADGSATLPVEGAIDHFIVHRPIRFTDGRPDWRRERGDHAVDVPEQFRPEDRWMIIEARPKGAPRSNLAVERLLLYPGESLPLLLPEGEFILTAWSKEGRVGDDVSVSVPRKK